MGANLTADGGGVCQETRRRVRLTVWAYAYEIEQDPLVGDDEWDRECLLVDLSVSTARPDLDEWWRANFSPDTGMWIHLHPEKHLAAHLYRRLTGRAVPVRKRRRRKV